MFINIMELFDICTSSHQLTLEMQNDDKIDPIYMIYICTLITDKCQVYIITIVKLKITLSLNIGHWLNLIFSIKKLI